MRRVEQLIDMARKLSGNTSYDANSGVPQDVFVQYFNNAQDSLMKEVVNLKTKFLLKQVTVPIVNNQETYSYPDDLYMQHIDTIQWLNSQNGTYYQTLFKSYVKEKITTSTSYPFGYVMQNDGYHLNPPINAGTLVVSYIKKVPTLQIRSGIISAATINGSNQLTALTVTNNSLYNETAINDDYFLCVVDKYGEQKAINIEYTSVLNGVFTLSPFQLADGETVSVGNYILVGKNTINKPEWPDICESYLIKHAVYDAKYSDSSPWSAEAKADMAMSFAALSGSFATLSDDVTDIMISNTDYIGN
jgi:hypothetical protein